MAHLVINKDEISILYLTKGPKYRLSRLFAAKTPITIEKHVKSDCGLVGLFPDGLLVVKPGWSWDGASGPTIDTPSTFRAALIHDALYQLMRQDKIPVYHKTTADEILRDVMIIDGGWKWRARRWFDMVQAFAMGSIEDKREVFIYPR